MVDVEAIYKRGISVSHHAALQAVYAAGLAAGHARGRDDAMATATQTEPAPPAVAVAAHDEAES